MDWPLLRAESNASFARSFLKGVLLASPILLIFGLLLGSADESFEHLMGTLFDVDLGSWPGHIFRTGFVALITGAALSGLILHPPSPAHTDKPKKRLFNIGPVEIGVVLGLVNALFLTFVILQLPYLFGGQAWLESVPGLTPARYARRGFFELVTVAGMALPLLQLLWRSLSHHRIYPMHLSLAGLQILLLVVMLASAGQRMWLYQYLYGLTELRLYTSAFMGWLGLTLVWFAGTVLRRQSSRFLPGSLTMGLFIIASLHLLNPDQFIVQTNLERAKAGVSFDANYATSLSADVVPILIEALPDLPPSTRKIVAQRLLERWSIQQNFGWRSWTRSQALARNLIEQEAGYLAALSNGRQQSINTPLSSR